jgi:hypothetical protein
MGDGIPVSSREIFNNAICAIVDNSVLERKPWPSMGRVVRKVVFESSRERRASPKLGLYIQCRSCDDKISCGQVFDKLWAV